MELAQLYRSLIDAIVRWSGSADLMHVHAGLAIYLGVQLVVRNRRGSLLALNAVFAAEMANEAMDWLVPTPGWSVAESLRDVAMTMMWPVAIAAVGAYRRRRWARQGARLRAAVPQDDRVPIVPPTTA